MAPIPKSGYTYPNRLVLIFLQAMEDVMGKNGVSAILNLGGLVAWNDRYPPDDLERGVDFAEFSAINAALEVMYGPRGGHGLARRSAWATFDKMLPSLSTIAGMADLPQRDLPIPEKMKICLPAMASFFSHISDQQCSVEEQGEAFLFTIHRCPVCWGRQAQDPVCFAAVGLLEETLRWLSGGLAFRVEETTCIAMGAQACTLRVDKQPAA
jgi:predicted hydrocarbon binding protein